MGSLLDALHLCPAWLSDEAPRRATQQTSHIVKTKNW